MILPKIINYALVDRLRSRDTKIACYKWTAQRPPLYYSNESWRSSGRERGDNVPGSEFTALSLRWAVY